MAVLSFPVGHLGGGEKIVDALIKESKEETGITIKPENLK